MDIQMKRGLLDICVLASIRNEDSYGYQIIKDIKPYLEVSESTLYPILRRLEEGGFLTVRSAEHNGRIRKYYHITEGGLQRLSEFQEDWKEILSIYRFVQAQDSVEHKSEESRSASIEPEQRGSAENGTAKYGGAI